MKEVYVVKYRIDHETHGIASIFSNNEAALEYIKFLEENFDHEDFYECNYHVQKYNVYDDYMSANEDIYGEE